MSEYGTVVELYWQGKTCSSATLSTTNPTWADLAANPGLAELSRQLTAWAMARPLEFATKLLRLGRQRVACLNLVWISQAVYQPKLCLTCSMFSTCPAHLISLITLIFDKEHKLWSFLSLNSFQPLVTSAFLGPRFLHRNLFSKTVNLCPAHAMRQVKLNVCKFYKRSSHWAIKPKEPESIGYLPRGTVSHSII
jgi:hypothetical protein